MANKKFLALVVCILFSFVFCFSIAVSANVKDELEGEINSNNKKIENIEESIEKVQGEMSILDDELSVIKSDIDKKNTEIDAYQKSVDDYERSIEEKNRIIESVLKEISETESRIDELNGELLKSEERVNELEKLFDSRLREFYKYGHNKSMGMDLVMLMFINGPQNISDVLDTAIGVSKIAESDKKLIEEIKQIRDKLNRDKDSLQQENVKLGLYKKDLEIEIVDIQKLQHELEQQKAILEEELKIVKSLEDEYQQKYDSLDQDVRERREEIIRIQQDNEELQKELEDYLNAINNHGLVGGENKVSPSGYLNPSRGPITSNYGWRRHPIRGTKSMHTGTDFGGRTGDPIVASRGGEVVFSGWYDNVYGNVVILNHGNGYQTFHAHLSRTYVKKGSVVDQGELIGAMGSTGLSTGAHLHFEIRKDGKSVDPMRFLR